MEMMDHLEIISKAERSTIVCGDFNMCFIENRKNRTTSYLLNNGFKQLVQEATHIDGGHIDHVYWKSDVTMQAEIEIYSPYYTSKDHDAMCISISEVTEGS